MPKSLKKITALLLTWFLFSAHLAVELAHQHFAPGNGKFEQSALGCIKTPSSQLGQVQPLCFACFFANAHHGVPNPAVRVGVFSQALFIPALAAQLLPQFHRTPCHSRAPPASC